jgi:hypothetical protein
MDVPSRFGIDSNQKGELRIKKVLLGDRSKAEIGQRRR